MAGPQFVDGQCIQIQRIAVIILNEQSLGANKLWVRRLGLGEFTL
jgi:hypothetical protein